MIYFYKHKNITDFSQEELDLLGYDGVCKFASERGLDPQKVFAEIKNLESQISTTKPIPLDISAPDVKKKLDESISSYIDFFNKNATYQKQAYVVIGNIGSGKNTYANQIEEATRSIIVDSDNFKSGEFTPKGYFDGLSSFFLDSDRERLQKPCSLACSLATEHIAKTGMNIILPNAPTSVEKLEKKIAALTKNNYDIHLIYIDAPYEDLAARSYYRYLICEYEQKKDPNGNLLHGRFVPVSIIKNYGDPCHETFVKAYKQGRYKSYKAFYNDKFSINEEIDIPTMI